MSIILFFSGLLIILFVPWVLKSAFVITIILIIGSIWRPKWTLWVCLGILWGGGHCLWWMHHILPKSLENKVMLVTGRIESLPNCTRIFHNNVCQFQMQLNGQFSEHVLISWYNIHEPIHPGELWQLSVKLKRARGNDNPGNFNYETWLLSQNIMAKGHVVVSHVARPQKLEASGWHDILDSWRETLASFWIKYGHNKPLWGIIMALTIGITKDIAFWQWQVFTNTGTIHLISISGFHISFMAGIVYSLVSFIWRRVYWLCIRWPAQCAASLGGIVMGTLYACVSGLSLPTERSLLMLWIFMGSVLIKRQMDVWRCFLYSLFVIIIWDPFAPLNMSFWLSYGSVGVILYAVLMPLSAKNWLKKGWLWFLMQWQIFLGIIPLSILWFGQFSISSLWANMVAIPATGIFVLPFALGGMLLSALGLFQFAHGLMNIAYYSFDWLYQFLSWISMHQHWMIAGSVSSFEYLILSIIGFLLLLAPSGFPKRYWGIICWLPLFIPGYSHLKVGEAWINILDVGQGLGMFIQTQKHTLIFDTGPKFGAQDAGLMAILPYLRYENVHFLDSIVISHPDMDHRGGLASILKNMPVGTLWGSASYIKKYRKSALICKPNFSWKWDGVTFTFLNKGLNHFPDTNNHACVLKISNGKYSALLPADVEAPGEKVLIKNYKKQLKSTLLIAGHHGSKTSSTEKFVKYTNPKYVIYSAGYLNQFHFPNATVVERFNSHHVNAYSTIDCGQVRWKLSNILTAPHCYKKERANFWDFDTNTIY